MVIDISTTAELSFEKIIESLEASAIPALLIDENMKIAYKSAFVTDCAVGLKTGAPISRFISESDLHYLSLLSVNESFCTAFDTGSSRCGVIFVGCRLCKLAVLSPFFADMLSCVDNEYERMSGYDITLCGSKSDNAPNENDIDLRVYNMSHLLSETISELKDIHGLPFFNATYVLRLMLEAAGNMHGVSRDIFELENTAGEVYVCGSQRNFALVLAVIVSSCAKKLSEGSVRFLLSVSDTEATFTVSAKLDVSSYVARSVPKFYENGKPLRVNMQDDSFWMYLSKLLADANLWDLKVESDEDGETVFTLDAPLLITGNELAVRDSADSELMQIIKSVLSFFKE